MNGTARYRIQVAGRLDGRWVDWFDGMRFNHVKARDGSTLTSLESDPIDQAGLHGLLKRLGDLNLCIHHVERIEESASPSTDGDR